MSEISPNQAETTRRPTFALRPPLILLSGLAGQAESWYRNVDLWSRHFRVYQPNLIAYEGAALHRRIEENKPIDIDYLTGRLHDFLDGFVQVPPYRLVANSIGAKVAIEFTARCPTLVDRLVLLSPSGLCKDERMPVLEGVRRSDMRSVVESVFNDPRQADPAILDYYQERLSSRRWRLGVLRTIRGTTGHLVRDRLRSVTRPTLFIVGLQDRVVNPQETIDVARLMPHSSVVALEACGHAPQVEHADTVNDLVLRFLLHDGQSQGVAGVEGPLLAQPHRGGTSK